MKNNQIFTIIFVFALSAILVVVFLKLIGYNNSTVIGGGVVGGMLAQ